MQTTVGVTAGLKRDPLKFATPTFDFAQYEAQGFSHPFYVESAQGHVRPFSQTTVYGSGMGHLWLSTDPEGALKEYGGKHVFLDSHVPEDKQALKVLMQLSTLLVLGSNTFWGLGWTRFASQNIPGLWDFLHF